MVINVIAGVIKGALKLKGRGINLSYISIIQNEQEDKLCTM